MDERHQRFRAHGIKFFFLEDAGYKFAGVAVAVFHDVNQWQRNLAFFQIAQYRLAELLRRSSEIEQIIDQLKRQARIAAIFGKRQFVGAFKPTQNRPKPRTPAEQARRLVRSELQGVFLGYIDAPNLRELQEFAFDHFLREVDQHVEDAEVAFLKSHLEGLHVEPVPCQNAAMIAPTGIRGGAPATRVGTVDHVVVDQRGAVKEFDNRRQFDRTRAAVTGIARGEQQQRRAQPFTASTQKIAGDFGNRLEGGGALSRQFVFHEHEVISDEIENLPGCEQRDGLPPGLHERRCACEAHSILCDRAAVNLFKVDSIPNYLACAFSKLGKAPSRPTSS